MGTRLAGIYTYAAFGACVLAFLPVMAATRAISRDAPIHRREGRMMRRLGRVTSWLTPLWTFEVDGAPPTDLGPRAYVVVANHESNADPFLLSWLPWDMRWVGKEELFKIPVVGWLMRLSGDIPVRRGSGESVREMMAECRDTLAAGHSLMIFPEGTRSKDGGLGPFKDGAFQIAIASQAPVLPVAVQGTRDCLPKGSMWFGRARASARILAPIETRGMTEDDVPRLRELARKSIADALSLDV